MSSHDPRFDQEPGHEPPDADVLAGEYVLGVHDAAQRRQLQARIDAEPDFSRLVQAWEARFAALIDEIAPVPVSPHQWLRLRTQLGWSPVEGGRGGVWQSVSFWRGATALAVAAAVAAIFIGRLPRTPEPVAPPPRVVVQPPPVAPVETEIAKPVTTLAHDDGSPGWLASLDAANGTVTMVPVPAQADAQGRVAELWLIPEGGAPRSLGLVSTEKAHSVTVPQPLRAALKTGSTLAITLEPPGGAPQGVPTGPIIAKGSLQTI
ncbi:MAG: anti-sigma factor [Luteimonas sp.]|nr:anti-sigma factor [Luteimonas sp.]